MPVYKTDEKYLRENIESVLNQSYSDFELLILDDCPTDTCERIIKSYNDDRIQYTINEKNLGISRTRNKLIGMARGEYLAVCDHDDVSLPERFAKEVEYLDNNPDVGVVSCNFKTLVKKTISSYPINDKDIKLGLMGGCILLHPACMIRKSVLVDNNIYYEEEFSPAEDYMMWCRLIKYTKFHNINEILFLYRDHLENTTHKQSNKMFRADCAIKAYIKNEYKYLYDEFLLAAKHTIYINLFGFIPFLTFTKSNNRFKMYLFGKIPLLSIKIKVKL